MELIINSIDHLTKKPKPQKIISTVPSITELLCDLNLEDQLIGVTKFCEYPLHIKKTKPIIGGTKKLKLDLIDELQPDLIIANKEENTQEEILQLAEKFPVYLTDIKTLEDNNQMILNLGKLCFKNSEARNIVDKINYAQKDFQSFIKDYPIVKVAYFIWARPWMAAGNNTFINHMLEINGFENMYANHERYPQIMIKKFRMEGDAKVVLLPNEPYPFKDEDAFELGRFTHHAKTLFVDGTYFSWYGSRITKAFSYFKQVRKSLDKPEYDL